MSSLALMSLLAGLSSAAPIGARGGFAFTGVTNRLITPNGDGLNDKAVFLFANRQDAAGSLKIYDARGHLVTSIDIQSSDRSASWDPGIAPSGMYFYVISIEDSTVSGSLAVIR